VASSFGWVVALKDGTRHYLEYTCAADQSEAEILEIRPVTASQLVPRLEDDAGVSWYQPDHINHYLGLKSPAGN
jgi:hypothetical protein